MPHGQEKIQKTPGISCRAFFHREVDEGVMNEGVYVLV